MYGMFHYAGMFNQCLSSWANKTPENVDTEDMFEYTSCPFTSDPTRGPWCRGVANGCSTCKNDPQFEVNQKNCNDYLKKKKGEKCNYFKKEPPTLVADFCPAICKKELCTCKDRDGKIKVKVDGKKRELTCSKIKEKDLCNKKNKSKDNFLYDLCPVSCGTQCL